MRLETYQHLVDILETSNTPMSTQEIATKIQLSRSVTSLYLNKLLEKGEVQQTGKKPVYWQLTRATTPTTDVFRQYIGSQGSAKKAIEQCKAAMLYPPLGMPLLIHGASGVGKSFLAKLIYEYLKNEQIIGLEKFYTVPIMPTIPNCYHPFSSAIPKAHLLELNQKSKDSWPKLIIPYSF